MLYFAGSRSSGEDRGQVAHVADHLLGQIVDPLGERGIVGEGRGEIRDLAFDQAGQGLPVERQGLRLGAGAQLAGFALQLVELAGQAVAVALAVGRVGDRRAQADAFRAFLQGESDLFGGARQGGLLLVDLLVGFAVDALDPLAVRVAFQRGDQHRPQPADIPAQRLGEARAVADGQAERQGLPRVAVVLQVDPVLAPGTGRRADGARDRRPSPTCGRCGPRPAHRR